MRHSDAEHGVAHAQVVIVTAGGAQPIQTVQVQARDGGSGGEIRKSEADEHAKERFMFPTHFIGDAHLGIRPIGRLLRWHAAHQHIVEDSLQAYREHGARVIREIFDGGHHAVTIDIAQSHGARGVQRGHHHERGPGLQRHDGSVAVPIHAPRFAVYDDEFAVKAIHGSQPVVTVRQGFAERGDTVVAAIEEHVGQLQLVGDVAGRAAARIHTVSSAQRGCRDEGSVHGHACMVGRRPMHLSTDRQPAGRTMACVMRVVDLRQESRPAEVRLARAELDVAAAEATVADVIAEVRAHGEAAVLAAGERFDAVRPPSLRVPEPVLAKALADLDPAVREALGVAISRVRQVQTAGVPHTETVEVAPGGMVTERWVPVSRVGLYVPGGRAVYPSSVVMNVVPAQIAGVGSIAVASPPNRDHGGWPHPTILAACALLGVTEVYAAGGAQAVALFAYGADLSDGGRCSPVSLITGPGNIYVTAAKRLVRGVVGIDSEAGPTEIMVLADDTANPAFIAADLISQAEHDVIAASVLVTDSADLVTAVQAELTAQVAVTKHSARITEALAGPQSAIVLVADMAAAIAIANSYGAEHLEIHTRDARMRAFEVVNAGAIFVGNYTPVSLGDYAAGSNHVLPTGGSARHSAGLHVQTFLRAIAVVEYSAGALAEVSGVVTTLAAAEDLPAHAAAITVRSA